MKSKVKMNERKWKVKRSNNGKAKEKKIYEK